MHRASYFVALLLAAVAFGVCGQHYVLDEFDLSPLALAGSVAGTVEALRETPMPPRLHGVHADLIELRLQPETLEELLIRLDSGPLITVARDRTLRLQPGQRVRVATPPE